MARAPIGSALWRVKCRHGLPKDGSCQEARATLKPAPAGSSNDPNHPLGPKTSSGWNAEGGFGYLVSLFDPEFVARAGPFAGGIIGSKTSRTSPREARKAAPATDRRAWPPRP